MDTLEQKDFQHERPTQTLPSESGKKIPLWIFIVVGLLAIALIGFLIFRPATTGESEPTPTPTIKLPTPEPTPEPSPEIDKGEISIEVLNGTGIGGEAAFLKGKLEGLEYSQIKVGNASKQDYEATEVYFASDVPSEIEKDILLQLKEIYKTVEEKSLSGSESVDVRIITGLKKGATPLPKSSPTPTSAATPTPEPESTSSGSTE